ncbi:NAD(P)-dependent oxidoreductase [uncultured Sphingomonas sp.]|uniref:NAD(P)-dependent oxidoreductase n=1 Tax=uncultured Sphingomonas sp. TaxID=158754 RepID=UPI0035CB45A3
MKIAVLAATGSTGSLVVDRLMARGHQVVAVSRSPAPPRSPASRFSACTGDLTDVAFLRRAIEGCDAVISCLGQSRASKSLFAKRTSPPDILYRVAAATITAIGDGSQHLIYMSAFGVGDDLKRHALFFRIILRLSSIHDAYLDHDRAERAIRASSAAWTIVRPPGLTDKDEEVPLADKSKRWSSFETATKKSVAAFLVGCAEKRGSMATTMTIGKP